MSWSEDQGSEMFDRKRKNDFLFFEKYWKYSTKKSTKIVD
jgi:hypothetical protein